MEEVEQAEMRQEDMREAMVQEQQENEVGAEEQLEPAVVRASPQEEETPVRVDSELTEASTSQATRDIKSGTA